MTENRDKPQHSELLECQIRSRPNPLPTTSRSWLEVGDIMTEDVATVCPGISVVAATKTMSDKNISCVIVSDNGDLSGIVTETDLLKRAIANGNDFLKMKIEQIMSSPVRSLPRNLSVLDASKIMETENIRRLVVVEDERLVGVITQTDVVRALTSYSMWKNVEELMTSDVAAIDSSASVKEAAKVMASRDISCLVAMENNTVAGIFTERDLLKRVIALKRNPAETILKNVMSSPVLSVPSNYSIPSASKMMEKTKIRRLLVMDDQNLLGVVTQTDILKAVKSKLQEEEENYFGLLNESRNCIYVVDLNNNITYVNPALMNLLEVSEPEELLNKQFLPERFWDNPDEREQILGQLKKASVEVHDLTLETTMGKKLFVTLFSTRIKNIKGQTIGSQGVLYDITAKKELAILKEMEQQLRSSEDLLRGTIESTADGILVVDEKGRLSHMNNQFVKIWDIPDDMLRQQDDQRLFEHLGRQLDDSSAFLEKLQIPCPDEQDSSEMLNLKEGKVLETYSLPLIREGKFAGRVWSFSDITERKQAEERLQKSEGRYKRLVEVSPDITYIYSVKGGALFWSSRVEDILGFPASTLIKNPFLWHNSIHKDDLAFVDKTIEEGKKGKSFDIEYRIKDSLGKWHWFRDRSISCYKSGDDMIIEGLATDITNSKQAEGTLRQSEQFLSDIFCSIQDGISILDTDYHIVSVNPTMEKWYSHSYPLVGKKCYQAYHGRDKPCEICSTSETLKSGKASLKVVPRIGSEGDVVGWLEVYSFPLIDNQTKQLNGVIEYVRDITDRKQAEDALQKARDELEVRVEQRTAELAQANKVLQSQIAERKNAERALELLNIDLEASVREVRRTNKEIHEFTHITAHDLKTPLRGIGTLADWLLTDYADKFDEQGQRQVRMLAERAKRADKLVDSILQYSNAGHVEEKQEQMDLNTVLPEIICEIDPPENIEVIIENKLPVLTFGKTHIMQVFHNLLSNAIKHMDKDKGRINVGCIEEKGFWKFSVADNGPGIDQKYYKKIFKIFQTLSPHDKSESAGIGLSIARKIVIMNGGRIWVESNPGEGSTFFFTLPKSDTESQVFTGADSQNKPAVAGKTQAGRHRRKKASQKHRR